MLTLLALSTASAHQLDEYLQATLVSITPTETRLAINLTPGVAVADKILALIDRDHDNAISTNEAIAYADLLQRDLTVRLDGHDTGLKLSHFNFPAPSELRTGWGIIQLEYTLTSKPPSAGAHHLTLENRHLSTISVYLINTALPQTSSLQITEQKRNDQQSTGEIAFTFLPPTRAFDLRAILVLLATLFYLALVNWPWRKNATHPNSSFGVVLGPSSK